jgi:hypothetical protein
MFTTAHVTQDLKSLATGPAIRILYTLMFAAIVEQPGVQGVAFKATSSRETRQLMMNLLNFYLQPYVALCRHSQSNSIWVKTSQHHLESLAAAVVPN